MNMITEGAEAAYRIRWEGKSDRAIQREIDSWRAHMQRHESHYHFHGRTAAPGELTDGDRVRILREILEERQA